MYDFPPLDVEKKQKFCKFSVWMFTVRGFWFLFVWGFLTFSRKNDIEMVFFSRRN